MKEVFLDEEFNEEKDWIELEESVCQRAVRLRKELVHKSYQYQWSTYLNALALFTFEEWINKRDAKILVSIENCTLLRPQYLNVLQVAYPVEVNEFKVCVIAVNSMDREANFPRVVVELAEYAAHFYVTVVVDEEMREAYVQGFVTYPQLQEYISRSGLEVNAEHNYDIPLCCFNENTGDLLLRFRCLDVQAIPIPKTSVHTPLELSSIKAFFSAIVESFNRSESPSKGSIVNHLNWEQWRTLLRNSFLMDWLYSLQTSSEEQWKQICKNLGKTLQSKVGDLVNIFNDNAQENLVFSTGSLVPSYQLTSGNKFLGEVDGSELMEILEYLENRLRMPINHKQLVRKQEITLSIDRVQYFLDIYDINWLDENKDWHLVILVKSGGNDRWLPEDLTLKMTDSESGSDSYVIPENQDQEVIHAKLKGNYRDKFTVSLSTERDSLAGKNHNYLYQFPTALIL